MSLILVFHNDSTGDTTKNEGNYNVRVLVGDGTHEGSRVLEIGRLEGFQRQMGWAELVSRYLKQRKQK